MLKFFNFIKFPLGVLIKIVQVIKNIFSKPGFLLITNCHLKKRTVMHD